MCTSLHEWVPGPGRRAAWFARLGLSCLGVLALGCGDKPKAVWTGSQTCAVGIPPEQAKAAIEPAQYPLGAEVLRAGNAVILRNFTLGPIGGFSCTTYDEIHASLGPPSTLDQTITQTLSLTPFDCWGTDGRMYHLEGSGAASLDQVFFTQTFDAWFTDGEGILICTSTFREVREQVDAAPLIPDPITVPSMGAMLDPSETPPAP